MSTASPAPTGRFSPVRIKAAVLAAAVLAILVGCSSGDIHSSLRRMQEKQRLIAALRYDLLLAVDAEKNALLSPVESDARLFVAKASDTMADLGKDMKRLAALVEQDDIPKEKEALASVAVDFGEMTPIDATLRGLAGRNTNLRAAALSRTEAALAVSRLQQALTPLIDASFCPASQEALRIVTAALSILALHAQHIEESTTSGMDTLEAAINRQNTRAKTAFDHLAGLLPPDSLETLPQAKAAYADFWQVTQEVLKLSRQNTNIEAESLAMGRKRLLTAKTLADLAALDTVVSEKEFTATR